MRKHITKFVVFLGLIGVISCDEEADKPIDTGFLHGMFVVNEGNFNSNNGSITYYDPDSAITVNKLFQEINGRQLGDVVQSFGVADDKGFIVVNNSKKVEVVDMETFVSLGTITGADYPRYFLKVTERKGYLTNGALAGLVFVIDFETLTVTGQIEVGYGPENLIQWSDYVFVANSGGWANDNTVQVIDPDSDTAIESIVVGDNPVDLAADKNGDIWVLCKGKVVYDDNWMIVEESDSKITVFDGTQFNIIKSFVIGRTGDYFNPLHLAASHDGSYIYFLESDGIYKMDITGNSSPEIPLIKKNFYGMDVDVNNGNIYGLDARGFLENGYLFRYSSSGSLIDSIEVGMGPNGVVVN
ncbi:MAG: YncE family protein [Bacteroidales bacterium]|nr:MAG: YncE family protein [Bacteroidales bacterium]